MLARTWISKAPVARLAFGGAGLRLAPTSALRLPAAAPATTAVARRHFVGQAFLSNFGAHCTQVSACTSLSTILYSPLGTAMLLVLAYNVVVICTKHVNYTMEITAKDYVQDQQLYVIMRYGIMACILLGMEVMFIEV